MLYDIQLAVDLSPDGKQATTIARTNYCEMYYSAAQQLAHHTCNGCNVNPGDLLASGTISGATPDSLGSMLELAWKGERPVELPNGETRRMLQDGDTVTMSGFAQGDGYRIGFGEVSGELTAA